MIGTNPLSVSIPSERYGVMNLDMATSNAAKGKVTLAAKEGRSIPLGWAIDENGLGTTDPKKAKCMMPFGGAKGFAIGLIIEILSSGLSGSATGMTMGGFYDFSGSTQNCGYFLGALDISKIVDVDVFKNRVDTILTQVKSTEKADGCQEIFIPGEIEQRKYAAALENGIEISDAVSAELQELSSKYHVPFECKL